MHSTIALIIPYFGKLPKSFGCFLMSAKHNPTVDFLVFTNDHTVFPYPSNVKVTYCEFNELINKIQKHFDFPVSCSTPYKLCDFRPAYGLIFFDELKEYSFWGYCDIDLVLGNIRHYLTEDILSVHHKLFEHGHLTIYRNEEVTNHLFMKSIIINNRELSYRTIFSTHGNFCFDEAELSKKIWEKHKVYSAYTTIVADIRPQFQNFMRQGEPLQPQVYRISRHGLERFRLGANSSIVREEFLYLHFQSRALQPTSDLGEAFLVVPNSFVTDEEITPERILALGWITCPHPFRTEYLLKRIKAVWIRLKWELLGVNSGSYIIPKRKRINPSLAPHWTPISKRDLA